MKEMEGKERNGLKIPAPVSDREDYVQGIGKKELYIIMMILFLAILFVAASFLLTGNFILPLMISFFLMGVTVIAVKRDASNESLIDQIRFCLRYLKMQKLYEYEQFDFFKDYISKEAENAGKEQ